MAARTCWWQGGYDDLLKLDLADDVQLAIRQAQVFDSAADEAYPGFYASRVTTTSPRACDYDGKQRSGVLEQILAHGWRQQRRSGGVAELRQRSAHARDPVSSVETYIDQPLPADAIEVYRGPAQNSDFLLKYVTVNSYDG